MAVNPDKRGDLSFSTEFNYLHVIEKGSITLPSEEHPDGEAHISLPEGLTEPYIRVFVTEEDGSLRRIGGLLGTASSAAVTNGELVLTRYFGDFGLPETPQTFSYFIYGGSYE